MIKEAGKAYLLAIKKRYRQRDWAEKKLILDEFREVLGEHGNKRYESLMRAEDQSHRELQCS